MKRDERLREALDNYGLDQEGDIDFCSPGKSELTRRFLLIENSEHSTWITTHDTLEAVASYHDSNSDYAWWVDVVIDLDTGERYTGTQKTTFKKINAIQS